MVVTADPAHFFETHRMHFAGGGDQGTVKLTPPDGDALDARCACNRANLLSCNHRNTLPANIAVDPNKAAFSPLGDGGVRYRSTTVLTLTYKNTADLNRARCGPLVDMAQNETFKFQLRLGSTLIVEKCRDSPSPFVQFRKKKSECS
jgi:hypothetical protein